MPFVLWWLQYAFYLKLKISLDMSNYTKYLSNYRSFSEIAYICLGRSSVFFINLLIAFCISGIVILYMSKIKFLTYISIILEPLCLALQRHWIRIRFITWRSPAKESFFYSSALSLTSSNGCKEKYPWAKIFKLFPICRSYITHSHFHNQSDIRINLWSE